MAGSGFHYFATGKLCAQICNAVKADRHMHPADCGLQISLNLRAESHGPYRSGVFFFIELPNDIHLTQPVVQNSPHGEIERGA
jgi:hypothetical protein